MISNEQVESDFAWLEENALKASIARGQRSQLDAFSRVLKARLMRQSTAKSAVQQEAEAYASEDYEEHLNGLEVAIQNDEWFRWQKDTRMARLDAWRTQEANRRYNP